MPIFNPMNEMRLNENHDIFVENGSIARTSTLRDSVEQSVFCMLRTEEGEAFADIEHGIPWLDSVCDLPIAHLDVAQKIVREKIEAMAGVSQVLSIKLKTDGRTLGGKFNVKCSNGENATGEF